jgi:hypothetical protein
MATLAEKTGLPSWADIGDFRLYKKERHFDWVKKLNAQFNELIRAIDESSEPSSPVFRPPKGCASLYSPSSRSCRIPAGLTIDSDSDSDSDDGYAIKTSRPTWARSRQLVRQLDRQRGTDPLTIFAPGSDVPDHIFGPNARDESAQS